MTSSISNNRFKLLVLDLDVQRISIETLRKYFTAYGPVEWVQIFPESTSAMIFFVSYMIVDHLIPCGTCFIGENRVRLRRYRLDQNNWHIDSHTLYIKLNSSLTLTEQSLRQCFREYHSQITKIEVIHDNQALISFSNYDCVDQILLVPMNSYHIERIPLVFERMMEKIRKTSRWDQKPTCLSNTPVLAVRDPLVNKLVSHIEYLTKQLREQPGCIQNQINKLEAEVFVLRNENARLKSKQIFATNDTIEQRVKTLEDISNRLINNHYHEKNRRERSYSKEKSSKRQRKYRVSDD
ncbi:unnamed protein product [Adineta ricciae]|uniref:RRM domain-containing protein n=1 Tax=Adineta ricciae TaxID=249248 RepID=A0A814QZA9_ADIRI|nr:unnamed protein product [Adineta ricciae]